MLEKLEKISLTLEVMDKEERKADSGEIGYFVEFNIPEIKEEHTLNVSKSIYDVLRFGENYHLKDQQIYREVIDGCACGNAFITPKASFFEELNYARQI